MNDFVLTLLILELPENTVTKLTTFSSGHQPSKGNIVQLRRTTNRKGKQAPAPPKRTRFVCLCEIIPSTAILITQTVLTVKYIIVHVCSLLSSCSSFRDSTFDDQMQNDNTQEDIAELNGISKKFKGIFVLFSFLFSYNYLAAIKFMNASFC